jgi:hypothetical protein
MWGREKDSESPQKFCKAPKASKLNASKPYSPTALLLYKSNLGFRSMESKQDIMVFFKDLAKLWKVMQVWDKSNENYPWAIPGYDNLLRDWVLRFTLDLIPSKAAASGLEGKVRLHFVYDLLFTNFFPYS